MYSLVLILLMFRVILYWALYILQYNNRIKETGNLGGKSCRMEKLHDMTCYADHFYNTGIRFSLLSYYIPISSEIAQNIIYSEVLRHELKHMLAPQSQYGDDSGSHIKFQTSVCFSVVLSPCCMITASFHWLRCLFQFPV